MNIFFVAGSRDEQDVIANLRNFLNPINLLDKTPNKNQGQKFIQHSLTFLDGPTANKSLLFIEDMTLTQLYFLTHCILLLINPPSS